MFRVASLGVAPPALSLLAPATRTLAAAVTTGATNQAPRIAAVCASRAALRASAVASLHTTSSAWSRLAVPHVPSAGTSPTASDIHEWGPQPVQAWVETLGLAAAAAALRTAAVDGSTLMRLAGDVGKLSVVLDGDSEAAAAIHHAVDAAVEADAELRASTRDGECPAVDMVIEARPSDLAGITVRRLLPFRKKRQIGPWVFLDHMGPTVFGPGEGVDVPPHPHIGLATVTYLLKGEIVHRDTTGVTQVISPGAVNWMSAGSGVVHSERTPADLRAAGHVLEGLQLWITLPANAVETDPYFHHYDADAIPAFEAADGKARGTVVLGSGYGLTSPVDLPLDAVMVVADVAAGAELDIPPCDECSVYVMDGQVAIGETTVGSDALAVLGKAGRKGVRRTGVVAQTDAKVALFGGATCDERFHWWNFVATSRERLKIARADWEEGRFPELLEDLDDEGT